MKRNIMYAFFLALAAVIICLLVFAAGISGETTEKTPSAVEIKIGLEKDELIKLVEESGIGLSGKARLTATLFPDEMVLSFVPGEDGELELLGISLNGVKIPHEKIGATLKNYLDFSGTLVYN